jgi:acetyltransferase-like isoleucine patch superfamily enzyme
MPRIPLKPLATRSSETLEDEWIAALERALADPATDRAILCRDTLLELAYPEYVGRFDAVMADASVPVGTRLALAALDPRQVTLEPEYYGDCDQARFQPVKPLLWLWYCFDRLPIGGQNIALGVKLRRALAPFIFKKVGKNFKCFQHVEFTFGYNLEVGDDVVVHRHVLLDDRGGIRLGDRVSISDYANIYSHTHSIVEQVDVTNALTILAADVRVTYHATVLAGVHVGVNGMVGAVAVATKDVRPYHVNVGIPAKSVRVKPGAPENEGDRLRTSSERSNP